MTHALVPYWCYIVLPAMRHGCACVRACACACVCVGACVRVCVRVCRKLPAAALLLSVSCCGRVATMRIIVLDDIAYLDVTQASKLLGVTPCRVRCYCRAGRIAGACRDGRSWLLPVASVESFRSVARLVGNPTWRKSAGG